MTTALAQYKEVTCIHLIGGKTIKTAVPMEERAKLYDDAVAKGRKTIYIGGVHFTLGSYSYADEIVMGSVDSYIQTLDERTKQAVSERQETMRSKTGRKWKTIEEVEKWIDDNLSD